MEQQLKTALQKIKEYWQNLSSKAKKLIILGVCAVVVFAVGLVLFLNFSGSGMVLLYDQVDGTESIEIYNALRDQGFDTRLNKAGAVEVRRSEKERAIAQMAMLSYPKSTIPYNYFSGPSGLTTTDMERKQLLVQELQDRLQSTISKYEGVKGVDVTIKLPEDNSFPWSSSTQKASGSVSLTLEPGYTPTKDQVSGIKYLVSKSVGQGMETSDVAVIDAATWTNLKSRDDGNQDGMNIDAESERLALQKSIEESLVEKALSVLTMAYDPADIRAAATVTLDYNKMVTESKEYMASEDSPGNTGVLQNQQKDYTMSPNQFAEGVAGEEENTDTPQYVDNDGDGVPDDIDFHLSQDFAVPYILKQIEKNNAEMVNATMAVMIRGEVNANRRQALIETVSMATNIAENNISIQSFELGDDPTADPGTEGNTGLTSERMRTIIIAVAALGIVIVIILILILTASSKKKRKRLAKQQEEQMKAMEAAEEESQKREMEFEEHRRQLQEAAKISKMDDAITSEVREFAQTNPEITANLLRAWLKEEEE